MNSCARDNCLRKNGGSEQGRLWGTAQLRSQISLKSHGQTASRAKDFGGCFDIIRLRRDGLLFGLEMCLRAKAALQDSQLASNGSAKETVIANFHEGVREDMLKETLKKLLNRKPALFELTGIRNPVLKGNLRSFHGATVIKRKQASITDGNAMDIGSQILERGLPIANGLAMNDPFFCPYPGRNLVKEFQFD